MATVQRQVAPSQQFSDLPPGAVVENTPQEFSDLPAGAQVEYVPPADQPGTIANTAKQRIAANAGIIASSKPNQGIGNYLGNVWDQVRPSNAAAGIREAIVPRSSSDVIGILGLGPVRSLYEPALDLVNKGVEKMGAGNFASGIRSIGNAAVPMFGASVDKAADQAESGDYAGSAGTVTGVLLNAAGPKILKDSGAVRGVRSGLQSAADRIYRIGATGMTPELAEFGTTRGGTYTEAGSQKVGGIRERAGQAIGGPVRSAPQNRTVSPGPVSTGLDDLKQKYLRQDEPPIEAVKQGFLDEIRPPGSSPGSAVPNMTPGEALDLKVKYQDRVYRSNKTAFSRGLTESSPEIASERVVPAKLGEQLVAQFPEIKSQNAIYGLASEIQPIIDRIRENAAKRNILPTLATIAGAGAVGHLAGQGTAGFATGIAMELMRNPAARSQMAVALSKAANVPIPVAMARVAGYLNAVGASEDHDAQSGP